MAIALKPAHDALETLLNELKNDQATLNALEEFAKNKTPRPKLGSLQNWLAALEMAKLGLEEWCPGGGFSTDVAPKK